MAALSEESYQCALHSLLQLKNPKTNEFQERIVKSFYGVLGGPKGSNDEAIPAQVCIFSPDQDPREASQAPLLSINLQTSQVCVLRSKPSSPRLKKSSHSVQAISSSFCINTNDGLCYEFRASDEAECQLWVNMLKFMIVFPFSSMPPEPQCNLSLFNRTQDPKLFKADCAWPVFIGHEEVGLRLNITGLKVLALKGKIAYSSQHAKLEVYTFSGQNLPVLSCQHDRIRCTGKLGKYVYVEVGTRCKGGPGLLWMFCGSQEKANRIRDALYIFLLKQQVDSGSVQQQPLSPLSPPTSPFTVPQPSLAGPRHTPPISVFRRGHPQQFRRSSSPSSLSTSPQYHSSVLSTSPNAAWVDPPLKSQELVPPLPPRRYGSDSKLNAVLHNYDLLQHPGHYDRNEQRYDSLEPLKLLSPKPYGYEVLEQPSPTAKQQDRYEIMESTKGRATSERYEFNPQIQHPHDYEILESLSTSHKGNESSTKEFSQNQPGGTKKLSQEAHRPRAQTPEQVLSHLPPLISAANQRKQRHTAQTQASRERRFRPLSPPQGERVTPRRLAATQRERHRPQATSEEEGHTPQRLAATHWHKPTMTQHAGGYSVPLVGNEAPLNGDSHKSKPEAIRQKRPPQKQRHVYQILEAPVALSNDQDYDTLEQPDVESVDD